MSIKSLKSIAFLLVGAILGVACSHAVVSNVNASTPQYLVVVAPNAPGQQQTLLNDEAHKGYTLNQVDASAGTFIFVKQ